LWEKSEPASLESARRGGKRGTFPGERRERGRQTVLKKNCLMKLLKDTEREGKTPGAGGKRESLYRKESCAMPSKRRKGGVSIPKGAEGITP